MNQPQPNPDALDMRAYDEALLAFKKAADLYPGQAVALKDAVMAYAKHLTVAQPVVNTVEELDALPHETVIRDNKDFVFEKIVHHDKSSEWWSTTDFLCDDLNVSLPARVLYLPEVKP